MQTEHFIINDDTPSDVLFPKDKGTGLMLPLNRGETDYANGNVANPMPESFLVAPGEWQARIQERKARKAGIVAECDRVGLKVKDQKQTNLCWANGPCRAAEIIRVMQGLAPIELSAASVAGPINGYKNRGGWGNQALEQLVAAGADPVSVWPNTAISSSYHTEANIKLALNYKVLEWWELPAGNLNYLISAMFHDIPVAVGYSYWSHEVCAVDVDWVDGAIALIIDNSWGVGWGKQGRGTLQGRKILPDDAVAPRVVVAA